MQVVFAPSKVERYPRLDTVLMIERALYKHRSDKTLWKIWKTLPKKVMWQTYLMVIDYLQHYGKIIVEPDKTVTWIWNPRGIEKLEKRGLLIERKN
jgi:hypothetical protein